MAGSKIDIRGPTKIAVQDTLGFCIDQFYFVMAALILVFFAFFSDQFFAAGISCFYFLVVIAFPAKKEGDRFQPAFTEMKMHGHTHLAGQNEER